VQLYPLADDALKHYISTILKNEDLEMWFLSQPPDQVSSFSPGFFIKPVSTTLQVRKVLQTYARMKKIKGIRHEISTSGSFQRIFHELYWGYFDLKKKIFATSEC
jgi:hypothetical protein